MLSFERDSRKGCSLRRGKLKTGGGIINTLINKLPVELHLPGTKLQKRLARGDPGINPLDVACKRHDIAYDQNKDLSARHKADYELEQRAWERVKSKDASVGEKAAALLVTNIMKGKQRFGLGCRSTENRMKKKRAEKTNKRVAFGSAVASKVRSKLKMIGNKKMSARSPHQVAKFAVHAARQAVRDAGGKRKIRTPRIIPIPKTGGFLPLLPIFAGLSALGTLAGGAAGVTKVINDINLGKQKLVEAERHNKSMESILLGKSGKGLYLKPYRSGLGLYLNLRDSKNY